MNRRSFLRGAVAGLLGCAVPAGLLTTARSYVTRFAIGIDHGNPAGGWAATVLLETTDGGRTYSIVGTPESGMAEDRCGDRVVERHRSTWFRSVEPRPLPASVRRVGA